MRSSGGGRILNLGSSLGHRGKPAVTADTTAKAGIVTFTRSVAKALVPHGIWEKYPVAGAVWLPSP